MSEELLHQYAKILIDVPLSHTWQGHGSAIFLEFGLLNYPEDEGKLENNPDGEFSIMIEWDWRIETGLKILGGSSSENHEIKQLLSNLVGERIKSLKVIGQIPELQIEFSNSYVITSFMTNADDPQWALIDHRDSGLPTLNVENGVLSEEI